MPSDNLFYNGVVLRGTCILFPAISKCKYGNRRMNARARNVNCPLMGKSRIQVFTNRQDVCPFFAYPIEQLDRLDIDRFSTHIGDAEIQTASRLDEITAGRNITTIIICDYT